MALQIKYLYSFDFALNREWKFNDTLFTVHILISSHNKQFKLCLIDWLSNLSTESNNLISVAVATGKHDYDELLSYNPDFIMNSFNDAKIILKDIY